MIRSMTGFGRAAFQIGATTFEVEIRTVNHRHLDVRVKLPRALSDRETATQAQVRSRLARGKVDCTVSVPSGAASGPGRVNVDMSVVREYIIAAQRLSADRHVSGELDVSTLLTLPGVVRMVEAVWPIDELTRGLDTAFDEALAAVESMRSVEGEVLAAELNGRLDRVLELVTSFEARSGEVVEAAKERLRKRADQIREETGLLDEARLHQEIVIAADRLDVIEELVRLRSHVSQFHSILDEANVSGPVGRRLDFLLQEMGREANTVGSKANDAPMAHDVVELKAELERLREQVQNVE